jgi:DNA-binding NarL/FixJ family response regulator
MALGHVLTNAAALSDRAGAGKILVSPRVAALLEGTIGMDNLGELVVPGSSGTRELLELDVRADFAKIMPPAPHIDQTGPLTEREREVVALIARGCSNREIAQRLVIAEGTAVRHVANILAKLGCRSRAQVAVWAVQHSSSTR